MNTKKPYVRSVICVDNCDSVTADAFTDMLFDTSNGTYGGVDFNRTVHMPHTMELPLLTLFNKFICVWAFLTSIVPDNRVGRYINKLITRVLYLFGVDLAYRYVGSIMSKRTIKANIKDIIRQGLTDDVIFSVSEDILNEIAKTPNCYSYARKLIDDDVCGDYVENPAALCRVFGREYLFNFLKYGAVTWSTWCIDNWGCATTLPNSTYLSYSDNTLTIAFTTMYCPPYEVFKQIANRIDKRFTVKYSNLEYDEDEIGEYEFYGASYGRHTYPIDKDDAAEIHDFVLSTVRSDPEESEGDICD